MSRRSSGQQQRGRNPFGSTGISSPTGIAGLVAWYRADLGVTIGTGVSQWNDQSGLGDANRNLTQGTGSAQPTLNASDAAYNNQATLSFLGASAQRLISGTFAASDPAPTTWYFAGNTTAIAAIQLLLDFSPGLDGPQIGVQADGKSPRMYDGAGPVLVTGDISVKVACCVVLNGASSAMYISASTTAAGSGNAGSVTQTALTIGSGAVGSSPLTGKVAELFGYSGAHTQAQRALALAYMGTRYAITIGA
jgi:hypothetical protein